MRLNRSCVRPALVSCLLLAVLVAGLIAGPTPASHALRGDQALYNPSQVRVYEQGQFVGTGTLVDRNWVLTVAHLFQADVHEYTFRFGGVDKSQDTEAGIRTFDRIVAHPDVPEIVMLHFTDPVPPDTPIAQVAISNPFTPNSRAGVAFGWSDENPASRGSTLRFRWVPVIDLEARANKESLMNIDPDSFGTLGGAIPFALPAVTVFGDSGGGLFKAGKLVGMHYGGGPYQRANARGDLYGDKYRVTYGIPLWPYAAGIRSVVNGEGTPGRPPEHDELRRRRLQQMEAEAAAAPPVMTGPAPTADPAGCDPGDLRCHPDPVTPLGILVGPSTTNGQVLTGCAGSCQVK